MITIRALLCLLGIICVTPTQAGIDEHFNQIKTSKDKLYSFFKKMPKGGELHYHLAGGPSPEKMLSLIANDDLCLQLTTFSVSQENSKCAGIYTKDIKKVPNLYNKIIQSWSMEGFSPGTESAHDHFFNGFLKYMTVVFNYRPQLIANVLERAAEQNEHYLEIMDIADNAHSINFGKLITDTNALDDKRKLLLNNKDFQQNVELTFNESELMEQKAREELKCSSIKPPKACQVKIKFLYYVLRNQPIDDFFAQALNAFEAVSRSNGNLIGVNLVQPEDGTISLRDYKQQMRIFNYLHTQYPDVHIALHAGEVTPNLVSAHELSYHIHDALFVGKAERIGHGVDITYEQNAEDSLSYMVQNQIPVEINLASNQHILNISGEQHPLNYYLHHQVPVVLSTDDEGVLRTDLTQQYVTATLNHHLDYPLLKQINRNTLTYAFIEGESIWANPFTAEPITACKQMKAKSCLQFIAKNQKAKLQWELEKNLSAFEQQFS